MLNEAMSKEIESYFADISDKLESAYFVARNARSKGLDPDTNVEIVIANDMAERVEKLIGVVAPQIVGTGVSERLGELEKKYSKLDWRVAFIISLEVAQEKFCKFDTKLDAINTGIRVGFAYVTNGVVASPLEGFIGIDIRKRKDGAGEYFAVNCAGPIRSAGGTGGAVLFLIADYVRKKFGYKKYDPTEKEIKRGYTEMTDYHERVTNLQYYPSEEETNFLIENLPMQVDGDPTEKMEVSNYKDLDRVATNRVRNGFCLVIAEHIAQKAPKLWDRLSKWGREFDMEDWDFLAKFIELQKKIKARQELDLDSSDKIKPDHTYIKDLVAGRPIIGHPLALGALRLRYGRARNAGLSSCAIHPLTMAVLDDYIAIGTQLKWERPSKGTVLSSCDYIEGPIVKLKSGEVLFLNEENVNECLGNIEEILFLGDALIPYGDFKNRAHVLVPPGYCEEWWIKELKEKNNSSEEIASQTKLDLLFIKKLFNDPIKTKISARDSYTISKQFEIPFHPKYTFHWKDIDHKSFLILLDWLSRAVIDRENIYKIVLPLNFRTEGEELEPKRVLELLGVPHKIFSNEYVIIENDWAFSFMANLGFLEKDIDFKGIIQEVKENKSILNIVNKFSNVIIRDKSGVYIGARMGRPEKAKIRKMTGSPHVLFPVGKEGGRLRCFQSALDVGKITAEFPIYFCSSCDSESVFPSCERCGSKTEKKYFCYGCNKVIESDSCGLHGEAKPYSTKEFDIKKYWDLFQNKFKLDQMPSLVKGVRGTSNAGHTPENLAKGIFRATHDLYVNKDGTIRYDMTELAITHFKPIEIGTSVERLKELGYTKDIYGENLVDDNQVLELKPQDVILPACEESSEEGADTILFRTANFMDDLLDRFYGLDKFYNLKTKTDLIGHLIIAIAPHISACFVSRIIGFSKTQGFFAHPMMHCAVRRDCDGDEVAVSLLLDALINFSRKYLPSHRGGRQDAPLILTPFVIPSEVDDMVFDMDVVWEYPLEFYRACEKYKMPWDFKIEKFGDRLGTPNQYEKQGFTHNVSSINNGARYSAYKSLPTMQEKVIGQMELAERIRAVDENDVARLVIDRHFIRDIKGNLRKFSMQQFRCVDCNTKYRRPPLIGKCLNCGGRIIFTISQGSVIKYLSPTLSLAEKYKLPAYMQQTLELLKERIDSVFGVDPEKQEGLGKWFS